MKDFPNLKGEMFVIGLTGGIGTGKTQVSGFLESLGAAIINADLVGHETYQPGTEGWSEVVGAFGEGVLAPTGEVDRKKLGTVVFNDEGSLKRLNAIIHPRIRETVKERIKGLGKEAREVVVVEAALLLEAKWTGLVDEVWVTTSPKDQVALRLKSRNNMDEEAVRARIRSQMSQADRVAHADVVVDNNGSLAELRDKVRQLWNSRVLARKDQR